MIAAAVDRMAALGPEWDAVFAAGDGMQSRRGWFEATEAAALPDGSRAHLVTLREGGAPAALLPMQLRRGALSSLTSPYTVRYQPLLAPGVDAGAAGAAFGAHLRRWPVARLEALDPGWAELPAFLAGVRRAGLVASAFDHFGNWTEPVAGRGWAAYLADRPGALREIVRRRGRAVQRDASVWFEVVAGGARLGAGIAAYEAVYASSWKVPEPYPRFNAVLLPMAAGLGALRLGVMWRGDTPVAAQYWTVMDGVATVLKLAHDDAAKALSPGTMLTAHMVRAVLEQDRVATLDFGRGDDPYKAQWTTTRQQRIGVMLANPRRLRGLLEVARTQLGRARRSLARLPGPASPVRKEG